MSHLLQRFSIAFVLVLLVLCGSSADIAKAQGTAGVGIRPATVNERMDPGEKRQFTVQLTNLSNIEQTYYLTRRDILGVREGNVPVFAEANSNKTGYELSDWITLDKTEVTLPANGSETVSYLLEVPVGAAPGSHFGSIMISVEPPEMRSSGASIGYEVANIITIRVAGEANDLASIRQFATSQFIYGETKVDFEARIENLGNTLVYPTGPLEVFNMFGKRVAMLQFNESNAAVVPRIVDGDKVLSDGLKTYNLTWEDEGVGFGRYEAVVSLVYGDEGRKNTISSTVSFWILPMNIVGPAIAALVILLAVVYIFIRIYVRRSVAMLSAGSTRRLIRTRQRNQFPVVLLLVSMLTVTALFLIVLLFVFA